MADRAVFQVDKAISESKVVLGAVKIQLYCVIIDYCLVAIEAKELKIDQHIYTILQIVGFSLHDKIPLKQLLTTTNYKNVKEQDYNLLLFN